MKNTTLFLLPILALGARGIDWVNPDYVVGFSTNPGTKSFTSDAQDTIVRLARQTAKKGPWSVTDEKIRPPNNDSHDYLSWAPYHWPDCNWCNSKSLYDRNLDGQYLRGAGRLRRIFRKVEPGPVGGTGNLPTTITKHQVPLATDIPDPDATGTSLSHDTTFGASSPTDAPYEKTSASHSRTAKTKLACTPSPTTTMQPSATWTTCPYVVRDGVVNPDVRTLKGPDAINSASESIIYNAISQAFTGGSECLQHVAYFTDFYFLKPETKMNPNMNFGQIVRGPEFKRSFTGILDLRGIVKVVNALLICRALKSNLGELIDEYGKWMSVYAAWLRDSDIGKDTASRPNNHGTFYISQLTAAEILAGDNAGAANTLDTFFRSHFLDQIARSGEQPFEAVRTRPFHYRCFNLEALITNAKMGDQLGRDLWSAKSKYGTTIQTAVDFTMGIDPKGEDLSELLPHVAAVAAAYGDPDGKYAAYLQEHGNGYKNEPFWFYDQSAAMGGTKAKRQAWSTEEEQENIGFECPTVFEGVEAVEVDYGVFVTCRDLEPFYKL